jgi:hypothetical protein
MTERQELLIKQANSYLMLAMVSESEYYLKQHISVLRKVLDDINGGETDIINMEDILKGM